MGDQLQNIRSVVVELQPETVAQVRGQIDVLQQQQHDTPHAYAAIGAAIPLLHFMSVTIFEDGLYDPVLIIEVNFDGAPGPFWTQFERAFGESLRDILRCGKTPRDGNAALFSTVTSARSRAPIAPLMEALTIPPAVGHQGSRGLDRARITNEGALFARVQGLLDTGLVASGATAVQTHATLRAALQAEPTFGWIGEPSPPRFPQAEAVADWARLGAFAALVVFAACLPGVAVSLMLPPVATFIVLAGAGLLLKRRLDLPEEAALTPGMIGKIPLLGAALAAIVVLFSVVCAFPLSFHHWHPEHYWHKVRVCLPHFAFGVVGLFPVVTGLLAWVRWLERRDAPQDAPPRDELMLRKMARREDKITQNHMGSIVHLKPGMLRAGLVRVLLAALGLYLRAAARDGYLGSMRTIHFAHWAIISNGGRLLFFSNFDGSWESYLDDFIEKAHAGLTVAWTSGVGFPPTRYLTLDGATQGRKFKAWARHSMAESLFWYSAYPGFTVNQIERQWRVAEGLRKASLEPKEAEAWALNL